MFLPARRPQQKELLHNRSSEAGRRELMPRVVETPRVSILPESVAPGADQRVQPLPLRAPTPATNMQPPFLQSTSPYRGEVDPQRAANPEPDLPRVHALHQDLFRRILLLQAHKAGARVLLQPVSCTPVRSPMRCCTASQTKILHLGVAALLQIGSASINLIPPCMSMAYVELAV